MPAPVPWAPLRTGLPLPAPRVFLPSQSFSGPFQELCGGPPRSSPKCGCLCCLGESWGLGSVVASLGQSNNRHFSNSGCLGRGRYVYLGQGPGRGCGFLPTPRTQPVVEYTDPTVPIYVCTVYKCLWSTYCVPSTVLHTSLTSENKKPG